MEKEVGAYLKRPQQRRHQLINLPRADVLPKTHMIPGPKMQHAPLHPPHRLLARLRPPLRPKRPHVLPERLFVPVHGPRADADDGAGGEVVAADGGAAGGDDALEDEARGRVHAEVFLDAGVHVGEVLLGEGEVDVAAGGRRGLWRGGGW